MLRRFLTSWCSPRFLEAWATSLQRRVRRNTAIIEQLQWENILLDRETVAVEWQLAQLVAPPAKKAPRKRKTKRRILPVTWD